MAVCRISGSVLALATGLRSCELSCCSVIHRQDGIVVDEGTSDGIRACSMNEIRTVIGALTDVRRLVTRLFYCARICICRT